MRMFIHKKILPWVVHLRFAYADFHTKIVNRTWQVHAVFRYYEEWKISNRVLSVTISRKYSSHQLQVIELRRLLLALSLIVSSRTLCMVNSRKPFRIYTTSWLNLSISVPEIGKWFHKTENTKKIRNRLKIYIILWQPMHKVKKINFHWERCGKWIADFNSFWDKVSF